MFAGIPAPIIRRRNHIDRIKREIQSLPSEKYAAVLNAYHKYFGTEEGLKFYEICHENGVNPTDFIEYMGF